MSSLGLLVASFYLVPVIITIPLLHQNFMLIKKYVMISFRKVGIENDKLIGRGILNQKFSISNPKVLDWDYFISKPWYISKNIEITDISFIKIFKNNKIFLMPNSKANSNFIKDLKAISDDNE